MKKTIFLFVLIGLVTSNAFAGKKKATPQEKRAKQIVSFVAESIDLNDMRRKVLFDALVDRFTSNKALDKNLVGEEKKAANKEIRTQFSNSLSAEFNKKQIKQINDLLKEYNRLKKAEKK